MNIGKLLRPWFLVASALPFFAIGIILVVNLFSAGDALKLLSKADFWVNCAAGVLAMIGIVSFCGLVSKRVRKLVIRETVSEKEALRGLGLSVLLNLGLLLG